MQSRAWAFWRRAQYIGGVIIVIAAFATIGYFEFIYKAPTCFDGNQNGDERGVDCGGACSRVCAFDVTEPTVLWAQAFRVTEGQYNAVAYVENRNQNVGAPEVKYTFTLYDDRGAVITTRSGATFLPPDSVYPIFEGRIPVGTKEPARTFLEIEPIEEWQTATAGREQFEVRSRILKNADVLPRLDTVLYNTSLEDEEDVEVVATIFNARGTALTASQSVVPRFDGREEKEVVFTWPEPIAKTVRSCEVPTDVVIAIDLSGSMNNDGGTPPQPITSALAAAASFAGRMREKDQVSVVTYATKASVPQPLSLNRAAAQTLIRNLKIAPEEETGETNTGDGILRAREELLSARHNPDARKIIVLLTDGLATGPGDTPEEYAIEEAKKTHAEEIDVYTIGLGSAVNQDFLGQVASDSSKRYLAVNAAALDRIYQTISGSLCEEGAAVIDIVPKTAGGLSGVR